MDGWNASIFGLPHPSTLQFIQQQISEASNTLTDAGRQFMAGAYELYERFNGSHAQRLLRAAARAATHIGQANVVRYLQNIGDFQQAPMIMHRWIMAEPTVRQLYHDQRCDGFSHSYVDQQPDVVGEEHYDYRRVMNGVVVMTPDGWTSTTWGEELLGDDHELSLEDQSNVLDSWWAICEILKAKKDDPTSVYNASLE